jgi:dGTPase
MRRYSYLNNDQISFAFCEKTGNFGLIQSKKTKMAFPGKLISTKRLGLEGRANSETGDIRSIFQRDYDRIIFSSPFRRMQNKTQVFPLPGSIFVHNRLTHSLEVASVGRSLGNIVANEIIKNDPSLKEALVGEIGSIVSSACLAHDLGNPPFGHSGESAIADFFKTGKGKDLIQHLPVKMQSDFTCFEGNANAFRLLSHRFGGKREGGFTLTYATLAAIVKYPYESSLSRGKQKFGFFQSEKETYKRISAELGLKQLSSSPMKYARHPLVYLVEAADDICYQIMDVEDAHKLKILTYTETEKLFLDFFDPKDDLNTLSTIEENFKIVSDHNERISYLRALVIGKLVKECAGLFCNIQDQLTEGEPSKSLISLLTGRSKSAMETIREVSINKIYNDRAVIEIEIAGYKILSTLMEVFTHAVMSPDEELSRKLLFIIPEQYKHHDESDYSKVQSIVDFVSGMTDIYALDLYLKINGINLPGIG